ncbi:hypothetical protein [Burkholderia stagnalis]|uniref:hypothetical protein n=1 Tax=Burkholderia stagnalis TaxID=1503054 RepID=UPI001E588419|nr:hypothetical protein [Burkholderia stagnalis]
MPGAACNAVPMPRTTGDAACAPCAPGIANAVAAGAVARASSRPAATLGVTPAIADAASCTMRSVAFPGCGRPAAFSMPWIVCETGCRCGSSVGCWPVMVLVRFGPATFA